MISARKFLLVAAITRTSTLISLSPLNDRRDDIPLLIQHFNNIICEEYGVPQKKFTPKAISSLQEVNWTGNIRELRNVVERLIILSQAQITEEDVMSYVIPSNSEFTSRLKEIFDSFNSVDELKLFIEKQFRSYKTS